MKNWPWNLDGLFGKKILGSKGWLAAILDYGGHWLGAILDCGGHWLFPFPIADHFLP